MRVVVAPDKFKGSLSSADAAAALSRGLRRQLPQARVVEHPVADGGDGTVEVALRSGFDPVVVEVSGPLGDAVAAVYALRGDTAVIEAASACGLALLPGCAPDDATAGRASTFGVGQLVADALNHGARTIVTGAGGSSTTDGGAGMVTALGVRCLESGRLAVPAGGLSLLDLTQINTSYTDPRLRKATIVVASDVDNVLLGPDGAAAVYGPQKGAGAETVELLDRALAHWADLVDEATGSDLRRMPGAGAAGGLGFGAAALLGATVTSGIELLLRLSGFDDVVAGADLVIVGEGSLDEQSLHGKGPIGVAASAGGHGVRSVAVAGRSTLTAEQISTAGLSAVYALSDLETDPQLSMLRAAELLEAVGERIAAEWFVSPPSPGPIEAHLAKGTRNP